MLHSEYYIEILMIIINFMAFISLQKRLGLQETTRKNDAIRRSRFESNKILNNFIATLGPESDPNNE